MTVKNLLIAIISITVALNCFANPQISIEDKHRISEAYKISHKYGDEIWKGFNEAPFAILLITDSTEFLMYHPDPSKDFKSIGHDPILDSEVFIRQRVFNTNLLATFPAVNGLSCIVMGTPENTYRPSTVWILTLIHEHFHQYQYTAPNYNQETLDLDLTNGDKTGMWMLNYPFPYEDKIVIEKYDAYMNSLAEAVESIGEKCFDSKFGNFIQKRRAFKNALNPKDYAYFSFQVWQEGMARYTEYHLLKAAKDYESTEVVKALNDYIPYSKIYENFKPKYTKALTTLKLSESKRVCFYAIGFAEGLLMDEICPDWKKDYLSKKFFIENYCQYINMK